MNSDLTAYFILTRPLNILLGALSIFLGALLSGGDLQPMLNVVLACCSGALIMSAGNVINDCFDIEIDRVNKPFRPIPAGKVSQASARYFAIILFVFGAFLSIFINWSTFVLAVVISFGLFYYSYRLKRTVLVGNLAVSFFSALALIYGSLSIDAWQGALIPASFAFLFHLGREVIKDIEDREADSSVLAATLPVTFGVRTAQIVASIVFGLLIILTFIPYILDIYGNNYLVAVVPGVDLVVAGALYFMWTYPFPESLRRISFVLKADMFVGLFAIYLGVSS